MQKNKLIDNVLFSNANNKHPNGFSIACITCNTNGLLVSASTQENNKYSVFIDTLNDGYEPEWITIDIQNYDPNELYTHVVFTDKRDISVIVVPSTFVYLNTDD